MIVTHTRDSGTVGQLVTAASVARWRAGAYDVRAFSYVCSEAVRKDNIFYCVCAPLIKKKKNKN